tara:strand:+ start:2041 stop:2223 length:183 start_codon:yes stop_codon:yes gene_type:complete
MIDELTDQVLDMIFTNKKIKEKLYPLFYLIICFNLALLFMMIYMTIKIYYISKCLAKLST